jgi:hypothetical protein
VKADFVACIADGCAFFWEGLEAVAGDEPRCLDFVLVEKLEKASCALMSCPESCAPSGIISLEDTTRITSADVARGIFASIRTQPARDSIDIDAVGHEDALLAHDVLITIKLKLSWSIKLEIEITTDVSRERKGKMKWKQ